MTRWHRKTLAFTILTLVASAVVTATLASLYLVRRAIDFDISNVAFQRGSGNLTLTSLSITNLTLLLTVEARNENYFPVTLLDVTIRGTHPLYQDTLGTGNLSKIALGHRTNTTFKALVAFAYDTQYDANGAYILEALTNCSDPSLGSLYADASITGAYDTWIQAGTVQEKRTLSVACMNE